jgi:linoleoyl-CoA desaturase
MNVAHNHEFQPIYRYKVHDKLYDLTDFVKVHPGGIDMFNHLKPDTNITPMVYTYHKNPATVLAILPKYQVTLTNDIIIQYDTNYAYNRYCELKKLVYDEIHEKKIPLHWSNTEIAYNVLMLSIYLGIWGYCFWNANNLSHWWMVLLVFMNIGFVALVFHETSHYTGFKSQKINNIVSHYIASHIFETDEWKYEHNYLHHSFTNTHFDRDFEKHRIIMRHSNAHIHYFHHKFQFIYAFVVFGFGIFSKGPIRFIKNKRWNIILFFIIIYNFGYIHTLIMYGLSGLLFLSIAQLSHIQHDCIQINNNKKNDFLYNQVSSSMNYRTDDLITRVLCFGLDIQIEHHLFPNIPHSSLRKIQYVVREYCDNNDIPYTEKNSIFPTIYSYICYLYKMGNP